MAARAGPELSWVRTAVAQIGIDQRVGDVPDRYRGEARKRGEPLELAVLAPGDGTRCGGWRGRQQRAELGEHHTALAALWRPPDQQADEPAGLRATWLMFLTTATGSAAYCTELKAVTTSNVPVSNGSGSSRSPTVTEAAGDALARDVEQGRGCVEA